jgi:hypothetical protein
MGPTTSIQFTGPATLGATISLVWLGSSGTTASASERFVVSRSTNFQTTQGTDGITQAQFFYTALTTDFGANFTASQIGDTVFVRSTNTNNPIIGSYSGENIFFNGFNITFIDPVTSCVYFAISPTYTESGIAIETSTDGGITWTYSPGGITSPRGCGGPITTTTLYRLRGLNGYSTQVSPIYSVSPIPGISIPFDEIKCRSPYLFIKPEVEPGDCAIYDLLVGSVSTYYTYTDCASGNPVTQFVPAFTIGTSNCAVVGSMTGGAHSLFAYCGGTYSNSIDYDTIKYNIKSWDGDIVSDKPTTISYIKEKQKVVNSQTNTYINLSNLLKEKLEGDINNYVIQNNPTQSQNIGIKESKWAYIDGDFYYNREQVGRTFSNNFFVIDGYTEPGEEQGLIRPFTPGWPQRVLLTDWFKRQYTQYSHTRIHFKTKDLTGIDSYVGNVYPGATTSTPISFVANPDISNEYIQSILVDTTQDMTYVFNYSTSGEIVWTSVTPNCKYENFDVVFKNKWGVLETLSFAKKSTKTLSISDSDYLRGIVNYNGEFDVSRHTRKHFNTSGSEEWTLNTDWIPEYMNVAFKELMLSEEIWLVDRYNDVIPVNKVDTQFSYKTSLNDKLIQYTMKVKLSHNIINNIL